MANYPICAKCNVAKELNKIIEAYLEFISFLDEKNLGLISDHARGFGHGQRTVVEDTIDELTGIVPHLQNEVKLRAQSDKGL